MKVAIIGGTGFVGGYLQDELLESGHQPVLLVRGRTERAVRCPEQCGVVPGVFDDNAALHRCIEGADAVIYNIGILREFPQKGISFEELQLNGAIRSINVARDVGVKRFILMSANGVKADGTPYQRTKYQAEQYLKSTDLAWTIFRPSVIFGDPRGRSEFCTELCAQIIDSTLPAPLFHAGIFPRDAGGFKMSPVHVEDVAKAFVKSLANEATVGMTFTLCGPDSPSWKEIIECLAQVRGKRKLALPAPAPVIRVWASLLDRFQFFPITGDQIMMLLEGNTGDSSEVFNLFSITPRRFNQENLAYLQH